MDETTLAERLGTNVRLLRAARGLSQAQMAKLAGLPRATWANLESGGSNPTLNVLHRVATALSVSTEELLARPAPAGSLHKASTLPVKQRGTALLRKLLPDPIAGMELDRLELPPGSRMAGVPHTPGTREYFACEQGELEISVAGERYRLEAGDVLAFRGDQKHGYANAGRKTAIGYSSVVFARVV